MHLVWLVADDLGTFDVPFTGSGSEILTPTLSRLANSGLILDGYYVQPLCSPSRASFMTGRHPVQLGLQHGVIRDAVPDAVPANETLLPELLRAAGFRTHFIGKWHLGFYQPRFTPERRGFETAFGYYTGNAEYYNHTSPCWGCGNYTAVDLHFANATHWVGKADESGRYSTELFADAAVSIVRDHATLIAAPRPPLFLYVAFEAVHGASSCYVAGGSPNCEHPDDDELQAPRAYVDQQTKVRSDNRARLAYAGMVGAMDAGVANISAALERHGMARDALLLFTTDNGAPYKHLGGAAMSNYPLRGGKAELWEGGVRGACFIAGGALPAASAGRRSGALIHASDWFPTLLALAKVDLPQAHAKKLHGVSVARLLTDPAATPKYAFRSELLHNADPLTRRAALRVFDLKIVRNEPPSGWGPDPRRIPSSLDSRNSSSAVVAEGPDTSWWRRQDQILGAGFDPAAPADTPTPMPRTQRLVGAAGATARNFFAHTPICCPSRAQLLTGRYLHNLIVDPADPPTEAAEDCMHVDGRRVNNRSFARALQAVGYRTALFGKYLNRWPMRYAPLGFDSFLGNGGGSYIAPHFVAKNMGWWVPEAAADGRWQSPAGSYSTAIIGNATEAWIRMQVQLQAGAAAAAAATDGRRNGAGGAAPSPAAAPWFAMMAPRAAHEPFIPAPWYAETWERGWPEREPRPPSWNASATDKHGSLATQRHMTHAASKVVTGVFRNRWRTLLSVDDAVAAAVDACGEQLSRTFVIFTSDHGFTLGEFSMLMDKRHVYDFDTRVPFLVRGPGIPAGSTLEQMATHVDLAPTILQMAGVRPAADGTYAIPSPSGDEDASNSYAALRNLDGTLYVEGGTDGWRAPAEWAELYGAEDKWQMRNLLGSVSSISQASSGGEGSAYGVAAEKAAAMGAELRGTWVGCAGERCP